MAAPEMRIVIRGSGREPGREEGTEPRERGVPPRKRRSIVLVAAAFGPGLLFAIASMGSSHFLLAPTAGAAFGYTLGWTILVAHLVKYPAFEYATRYTIASGENVLEGFNRLPGPRGWAVKTFFVLVSLEAITIIAGVTAVAGAVLLAAFPQIPLSVAIVGICAAAALLLWFGAYRVLERASIAILVSVILLTLGATAIAMPDVAALATGAVIPVLPVGAALLVGGLLGYMPAPIELAIIESLWFKEKGIPAGTDARREKMREALLDFRVGYVTSVLLGLLLLALGAALLNPRGLVPAGTAVFTTITEIYRTTLGPSVVPIYLLGAFLGMFATSYGVLDGFPRSLSASLTAAGRPATVTRKGRDVRYWILLYAMFLLGLGAAILLPNPALLVTLAATGTVIVGPLWYALIIATTHRLPEPFKPTRRDRVVAWLGWGGMVATAVYVAYINLVPA